MAKQPEVLIIGGGAAGMMAALSAAEAGYQVTISEKNDRLGRKLAATGNGRCNLSNTHMGPEFFHGRDPYFVYPALNAFDPRATRVFFAKMGLVCYTEEDGKVFPLSNQASSVVDCLRYRIAATSIRVLTNHTVETLLKQGDQFIASSGDEKIYCDKVIVTTGGQAAPQLGGTGRGYQLLEVFGHHLTPLFPALVQLKTDNTFPRAMQGIKFNGAVSVFVEKAWQQTESGEILFTEFGVSGPAVFSISRCASFAHVQKHDAYIQIDLLPQCPETKLFELLKSRIVDCPYLTLENFFTGLLHNKIGKMLFKYCQIKPLSQNCETLSETQIKQLVVAIKKFTLPLTGTMGFTNAQITAGGVSTAEVDPHTMQSKLCRGLYLAGEVLDIDGICGGYNLQWAWSSGHLAGRCYD